MEDEKVRYLIDNYIEKIKDIYAANEVWLWGSRAYGTPNKYSDIDLIVVSDKFSKIKFIRRMYEFISKLGLLLDRKAEVVDVLCYTPEEFERKKQEIGVVREAV
ncbi:MAG: nucleotidyltransferase domain-containing protein, partial [Candidatus Desantisbacteria bacterium]